MKLILKIVISSILTFVPWLAGGFIVLEFNPSNWTEEGRYLLVVAAGFTFAGSMTYLDVKLK